MKQEMKQASSHVSDKKKLKIPSIYLGRAENLDLVTL